VPQASSTPVHTESHLFEQESGRAGRDGLPAESVLYYATVDRRSMDYLTQKGDKRQKKKRRNDDLGGQPATSARCGLAL